MLFNVPFKIIKKEIILGKFQVSYLYFSKTVLSVLVPLFLPLENSFLGDKSVGTLNWSLKIIIDLLQKTTILVIPSVFLSQKML